MSRARSRIRPERIVGHWGLLLMLEKEMQFFIFTIIFDRLSETEEDIYQGFIESTKSFQTLKQEEFFENVSALYGKN